MRSWVFFAAVAGCGYAPIHGGGAAAETLHVHLEASKVPDAVASGEVLAGAREELARMGALAPGDGFPRLAIEILRADEASEGIAAVVDAEGRHVPQARATRIGLVARGWVVRTPDGEHERDTGDLRVFEAASVAQDARAATFAYSDALRVAGRHAGQRIAARIMGLPSPSDE